MPRLRVQQHNPDGHCSPSSPPPLSHGRCNPRYDVFQRRCPPDFFPAAGNGGQLCFEPLMSATVAFHAKRTEDSLSNPLRPAPLSDDPPAEPSGAILASRNPIRPQRALLPERTFLGRGTQAHNERLRLTPTRILPNARIYHDLLWLAITSHSIACDGTIAPCTILLNRLEPCPHKSLQNCGVTSCRSLIRQNASNVDEADPSRRPVRGGHKGNEGERAGGGFFFCPAVPSYTAPLLAPHGRTGWSFGPIPMGLRSLLAWHALTVGPNATVPEEQQLQP
jgi:hypothetical protein